MGRLYRVMTRAADGRPLCGARFGQLGVRPNTDIPVGANEEIQPGTGGMSVTPGCIDQMPLHLRPVSHGGTGKLPIFEVERTALPMSLAVRPDPQ